MAQAPRPAKDPHRLRNTGIGLLGLVLTLVIAIGICEILEWPFLRGPLQTQLQKALDRPVTIGEHFGVRLLFSLRAHADQLVIGPGRPGSPTLVDDQGRPRDFMRADAVRLALGYRTLWQQYRRTGEPLHVGLLAVDGLELNLKRDADGRANWQFGAAAPATPASAPGMPTFERLMVKTGEVRVEDVPLQVRADARLSTYEGTAVSATAPATGASGAQVRIAEAAASHVLAAAASAASAAGMQASGASAPLQVADDMAPGLRIDGTGTYRKAPLELHVRSSGLLPIANSEASAPPIPVWLEAHSGHSEIRLDGTATDVLHFGGLDANFRASGPSLAAVGDALGVTLPTTERFATHGRLRKQGDVWQAGVAAMDIGSSRLHGDFRFDTGPAVPVLSGTLGGARLALADLGPAFGGSTSEQPKETKAGHVLPDREFDIPSLKVMNADVGIGIDVVDFGTDKLEPFKPLRAKLTLQDGVLRLHDILARTSAGQVQGGIGLDSRPKVPKWDADLRWDGIRLERFVKAQDIAAPKDAGGRRESMRYISGALGGNAQLKGEGNSTAKLLGSLDGKARLWVRDGEISHILLEGAGIDVAQALGVYIKGDNALPMQCAIAQMTLADGAVKPDVAVIDTHDTTLVVGGDLSLARETLDLRMVAHPHDFSPLALRTPVHLTGTFSDPHVRPEAKPLLLRGAAAAALSLASPAAALLALVDFRQAEKDVCSGAVARLDNAPKAALAPSAPAPAPRTTAAPARAPNARSSH